MSGTYSAVELQTFSLEKLHALYYAVQQELRKHAPGSSEYEDALASLENIARAIHVRRVCHHGPKLGR
ncbi:MAG: hypothetical protein AB1781_07420 [Pseudomonadota bacterium]